MTARDAYQVRELLEFYGVSARLIGRHYGKHKVLKGIGTCWRALAVTAGVRKEKIDLAITHGSRACVIACALLGIPDILLFDYEFAAKIPAIKPTWLMAPGVIADRYEGNSTQIISYPGIKEDVYLSRFHPDYGLKTRLGVPPTICLLWCAPRPPKLITTTQKASNC